VHHYHFAIHNIPEQTYLVLRTDRNTPSRMEKQAAAMEIRLPMPMEPSKSVFTILLMLSNISMLSHLDEKWRRYRHYFLLHNYKG
jgi:hypothetical protein